MSADIITLPGAAAPTIKKAKPRGARRAVQGDEALNIIDRWKIARFTQQAEWARNEMAVRAGQNDECDLSGLKEMRKAEDNLLIIPPATMLGCRELLMVVLTILADGEIDPDATIAAGPVKDLVRMVYEVTGSLPESLAVRGGAS